MVILAEILVLIQAVVMTYDVIVRQMKFRMILKFLYMAQEIVPVFVLQLVLLKVLGIAK